MRYHEIIRHYEACLRRHGDSHLGVDWPNADDARTRYDVMLDVVRPSVGPVRLLDVGCGSGALLTRIRERGLSHIQYEGLDISDAFVALARHKFPDIQFHTLDLLATDRPLPACDYAVMNGVFTEKLTLSFDEMFSYFRTFVGKVFEGVRCGLAVNVMSTHVQWQRDDLFHLPIDAAAAFVTDALSRHFIVRADYGLFEYTLYIYRRPA